MWLDSKICLHQLLFLMEEGASKQEFCFWVFSNSYIDDDNREIKGTSTT